MYPFTSHLDIPGIASARHYVWLFLWVLERYPVPCLQGTCFTTEPAPQPTPRGSGCCFFCDTYPSYPDHKSLRDSSLAILHDDVLHSCPSSSDRYQHSVPHSLISHPRRPHWTFTVVTGYISFLWWVVRLHLYHLYSKPSQLNFSVAQTGNLTHGFPRLLCS